MPSKPKIRILLADDHVIFREGVKRVIEMEQDLEVVAEAGNGEEAVQLVEVHQPDVVLMDINMPYMNGAEATEEIVRKSPATRVIILSIHDDESYVYKTLQSGADGYLLKDMDVESLAQAIRVVHEGGAYIHPTITGKLVDEFRRMKLDQDKKTGSTSVTAAEYRLPYHLLTKREAEVLQLMAEGKSNKMLGEALFISEKTVKNHVSSVLQKMRVQDRTQAVVEAIKNGWVKV